MRSILRGFRVAYEPEALVLEREDASVGGEFSRRRRIAAGNCQQVFELSSLLSPRYGWVAFSFFSHKVLRTLAPFFLIGLLMGTLWLPKPWAAVSLAFQVLFYASALAGFLAQRSGHMIRFLSAPLYFCLGNLAMLSGLLRYFFRRDQPAWERSRQQG